MINQVFSIRGATTLDFNTEEEIVLRSVELMREILDRNGFATNDNLEIIDYIVSSTNDITVFYPAQAIRESGIVCAPVFSTLEPSISGALKMCVRILVRVSNSGDRVVPKHVYLRGARQLRKDLLDE